MALEVVADWDCLLAWASGHIVIVCRVGVFGLRLCFDHFRIFRIPPQHGGSYSPTAVAFCARTVYADQLTARPLALVV